MPDAQMPLMAGGWMDRYNTYDKSDQDLNVPVYVLDDNLLLSGKRWCVTVRLYGARLQVLAEKEYKGKGTVGKSGIAGFFHADADAVLFGAIGDPKYDNDPKAPYA